MRKSRVSASPCGGVAEYDGRAIKSVNEEFNLPSGDVISCDFGKVPSAGDPRIGQLPMKFLLQPEPTIEMNQTTRATYFAAGTTAIGAWTTFAIRK